MFRVICVFAVFGLTAAEFTMPQLYAKFSVLGSPGVDSFFAVPRTEEQALELKWTVPEETKANATLFKTICNPDDVRVCILTDQKGSICGYQLSVPVALDSLNMPGFNFTQKGYKALTLFGQDFYSNQIFFVSQDVIEAGGRDFNNQTGDGLYLQVGEQLLNIPTNEANMNSTKFVHQNCFVRMGQHYFYDVRSDLTPEEFMPWFTLFDHSGNLSGFGFLAFGASGKSWFEDVNAVAIKMIAPDVPQWVMDYLAKYGLGAHHVYFGDQPWSIKCKSNEVTGKY